VKLVHICQIYPKNTTCTGVYADGQSSRPALLDNSNPRVILKRGVDDQDKICYNTQHPIFTHGRPLPRSIWKLAAFVKLSAMYIVDVEIKSQHAGTKNRNHFETGIVTASRPSSEQWRHSQYTPKHRNSPMNIPHACETAACINMYTVQGGAKMFRLLILLCATNTEKHI